MATFFPELRSLHSPDLPQEQERVDPADAAVLFEASVGPKGQEGAEVFSFVAITPRALARDQGTRWGRGYLILNHVSWAGVEAAVRTLLSHCVSAFRSLQYQRQIFERKIKAGDSLEDILKVNAPPGYSEHHTGRAVDLTTPGCPPLAEEFERSAAFAWLVRHAHRFGFAMTYPRENRFGIAYEPWHWAAQE